VVSILRWKGRRYVDHCKSCKLIENFSRLSCKCKASSKIYKDSRISLDSIKNVDGNFEYQPPVYEYGYVSSYLGTLKSITPTDRKDTRTKSSSSLRADLNILTSVNNRQRQVTRQINLNRFIGFKNGQLFWGGTSYTKNCAYCYIGLLYNDKLICDCIDDQGKEIKNIELSLFTLKNVKGKLYVDLPKPIVNVNNTDSEEEDLIYSPDSDDRSNNKSRIYEGYSNEPTEISNDYPIVISEDSAARDVSTSKDKLSESNDKNSITHEELVNKTIEKYEVPTENSSKKSQLTFEKSETESLEKSKINTEKSADKKDSNELLFNKSKVSAQILLDNH